MCVISKWTSRLIKRSHLMTSRFNGVMAIRKAGFPKNQKRPPFAAPELPECWSAWWRKAAWNQLQHMLRLAMNPMNMKQHGTIWNNMEEYGRKEREPSTWTINHALKRLQKKTSKKKQPARHRLANHGNFNHLLNSLHHRHLRAGWDTRGQPFQGHPAI